MISLSSLSLPSTIGKSLSLIAVHRHRLVPPSTSTFSRFVSQKLLIVKLVRRSVFVFRIVLIGLLNQISFLRACFCLINKAV
ncbi:hypothetical protein L6452_12981 [Arctium lappa]|uniref:Uncharacterized protein n=1 Tax=Arctium lappa TaxID=4217 RepID=A0ACB9CGV5_ARCLA|nr:hypothetical protein L6452_12981 [Arctium lappa]